GLVIVLDLVVLPGSSFRPQDVYFWLSFLRAPSSDIVWPFVRGERNRETPTLSLALNVSHKRRQTVGAILTSCPRVSELLTLYLPTVHVSLLSQRTFYFKSGRRGGGGHLKAYIHNPGTGSFFQLSILGLSTSSHHDLLQRSQIVNTVISLASSWPTFRRHLPRIALNALSESGAACCLPWSSGRRLSRLLTPIYRGKSWIGPNRPGSGIDSALASDSPWAHK
ncbi:hypothetical protein PanWU01x14_191750, partial [Parasponia andersonii]